MSQYFPKTFGGDMKVVYNKSIQRTSDRKPPKN